MSDQEDLGTVKSRNAVVAASLMVIVLLLAGVIGCSRVALNGLDWIDRNVLSDPASTCDANDVCS